MSFFKAICLTLCRKTEEQIPPSTELEFIDEKNTKNTVNTSNLHKPGSLQKNNAVDSNNVEIAED